MLLDPAGSSITVSGLHQKSYKSDKIDSELWCLSADQDQKERTYYTCFKVITLIDGASNKFHTQR